MSKIDEVMKAWQEDRKEVSWSDLQAIKEENQRLLEQIGQCDMQIRVLFECVENGVTGTTSAPVKRVEWEDDGTLTAVLDYWPPPAPKQKPLTDEQIDRLLPEIVNGGFTVITYGRAVARAIEAAATEPLLQRIAELERVCDIFEGNWNECLADCENIAALKERIAELERQLEEARKQMESQKDEWLSWEAKRKALEKEAGSYRQLRNGSNWPAVFASHYAPEPLRGEELDEALQKGQS